MSKKERPAESSEDLSRNAERLGELITAGRAALLENEQELRETGDVEAVHRFRVATRRLRALFAGASPPIKRKWGRRMERELAWLGRSAGPLRDLDVLREGLLEGVDEDEAELPRLIEELESMRDEAYASLVAQLEQERYSRLIDALDIDLPPMKKRGPLLSEVAARDWAKVLREIDALPQVANAEELHRLRILVKRARYSTEAGRPFLGKSAKRGIGAAKAAQDVLGAHHDAVVALDKLKELVASGILNAAAPEPLSERIASNQLEKIDRALEELPRVLEEISLTGKAMWSDSSRFSDKDLERNGSD